MFWNSSRIDGADDRAEGGQGDGDVAAGPRLGIAFGSGAARGWAHIGVIQRLAEAGIVPDVVAGTSIGALVAGCHMAGKLPELEEFARSLNRRRVFGLLDISWRGSGLIGGSRLTDLLNDQIGDTRIESLPRPLICIATELATGHELWLKQGPLVEAMRASYALPGVFQPVYLNRRWLIDGAVVNPIPVSACRAMGARVVIAVNLNTDAFGSGTVIQAPHPARDGSQPSGVPNSALRALDSLVPDKPSITAVLVAAFNISQDRLARSRMAGDPPDITIAPRAADIGIFDFDRAADSIKLGREAAESALPHIESLMDAFDRADFDPDR